MAIGAALVWAVAFGTFDGDVGLPAAAALVGYAVLMLAVCALACIVPARRAMAIEPTEALRIEG